MITPNPLPSGGTIAVIAPSSRGEPDAAGIAALESRGYTVRVHTQNHLRDNQSAGSPAQRAAAVMDVFADPDVHAVIAARGGNRAMHMLPALNFNIFKTNPKPFVGFSDSTALLNAVYAQSGLTGWHGPTLTRLGKAPDDEIDQMIACLRGTPTPLQWNDARTLQGGTASGPMIGGNLSVFASLCGTPYMPDATGAILFLEDIGDELSRYDRMLAQLRLAGLFDTIAGLVIGRIGVRDDTAQTPFGFSLDDIVHEHTHDLRVPVVTNAPFGHAGAICTLPVGARVTLDADKKTLTP